MAETDEKTKSGIGPTLWSLLMIFCLLLVVAHLVNAVRHETVSEEDLVRTTFTRSDRSHENLGRDAR
jgi:hypothetical protein